MEKEEEGLELNHRFRSSISESGFGEKTQNLDSPTCGPEDLRARAPVQSIRWKRSRGRLKRTRAPFAGQGPPPRDDAAGIGSWRAACLDGGPPRLAQSASEASCPTWPASRQGQVPGAAEPAARAIATGASPHQSARGVPRHASGKDSNGPPSERGLFVLRSRDPLGRDRPALPGGSEPRPADASWARRGMHARPT